MISDKTLQGIIKEVSEKNGIPIEVVDLAYREFWNFIKTTIESLPLNEVNSEEDFNKLRTSFNIVGIGKLSTSWEKISALRRRYNYIMNKVNEKKRHSAEAHNTNG